MRRTRRARDRRFRAAVEDDREDAGVFLRLSFFVDVPDDRVDDCWPARVSARQANDENSSQKAQDSRDQGRSHGHHGQQLIGKTVVTRGIGILANNS